MEGLGAVSRDQVPYHLRNNGDDDFVAWPEHLPDHPVDEAVAIKLCRIDMVYAEGDSTFEKCDGLARNGLATQIASPGYG
jgi:hypothetical protein